VFPRLAYLGITTTVAMLRLLPRSDRDKDVEILVLRHQLAVPQRQLDGRRIQFQPADRALLAALLHRLPRPSLRRLRLLVHPDTILRWHRHLLAHHHTIRSMLTGAGWLRYVAPVLAMSEGDSGRVLPNGGEVFHLVPL